MDSSTLTALQDLKATEFHSLCDDVLPRISGRFTPLVPHGRNEKGDSIRGQPDSYVGDSAATCRIAIQHTTQRDSWWAKVIEDIEEARKKCPLAQEIVVLLPRDIDREGPTKGSMINWRQLAELAASPATLTILHGRTLTHQLDTTCQDIRRHYLDIPFSRLSWHSLMTACRESSSAAVQRLISLGRYEPDRYADREADEKLFDFWQECLRNTEERKGSDRKQTFIPLIADSGIGKTSLLARFVSRSSAHVPMLLLVARDISLQQDDSLLRAVMERLQGAMEPQLRYAEEAHLATMLQGKGRLTVVLDGLDEARDPDCVRRALDTWMRSRLGQGAVFIVSSRPEFWRNCQDATWANAIFQDVGHPRAARPLRHEQDISTLDPMQGIALPQRFSKHELLEAWQQAGHHEAEFWLIPADVRREFTHPFTLRAALDLLSSGITVNEFKTRNEIVTLWLRHRLRKEADATLRITEYQYWDCLVAIAKTASNQRDAWISVDSMGTVPRFDVTKPPGPVVERLIAANILETHPMFPDRIRFSFEAVYDFFAAEAMIADINTDPTAAATRLATSLFSKIVNQIERIGARISSESCRELFVRTLLQHDPPMAAVALRAALPSYGAECRAAVVDRLSLLLHSPREAEQGLAVELLGRILCKESADVLAGHWAHVSPSRRLHGVVSNSAISHGIVALVPTVFRTWWFTRDHYYLDLRSELLAASPEFRQTLLSYAGQFVPSDTHSDDYRRALGVMAHLRDSRAIDVIRKRTELAIPFFYESMCLLAVGTPQAVALFATFVDRYIEASKSGQKGKQLDEQREAIFAGGYGLGGLASYEVENYAVVQMESAEHERQSIGRFLARKIGTERVLKLMVKLGQVRDYSPKSPSGFGFRIDCDAWLELWSQATTADQRWGLIQIAADLRDIRIEEALISGLEMEDFAHGCAQSLSFVGSDRACPRLRKVVISQRNGTDKRDWNRSAACRALGVIRDPSCVEDMVAYLESEDGAHLYEGTICLASIGTTDAELALLRLRNQSDELLVRGLVHFGSRACIEKAIAIARGHDDSAAWLLKNGRYCFGMLHGWSSQRFRIDVQVEPFLEFVLSSNRTPEMFDHLSHLLDHVDGPAVRSLLRQWYSLKGTDGDVVIPSRQKTTLSEVAFHDLATRGDDSVLQALLDREVEQLKGYHAHDIVIDRLAVFDQQQVKQALRKLALSDVDNAARGLLFDLLGYLGDQSDLPLLANFEASTSKRVADAAFEAKLRLCDPLRLAEHW